MRYGKQRLHTQLGTRARVRVATCATLLLPLVLAACGYHQAVEEHAVELLPDALAAPRYSRRADLKAWLAGVSQGWTTFPEASLLDACVRVRPGVRARSTNGLDALVDLIGSGVEPAFWLRMLELTDQTEDAWDRAEVIQYHLALWARHVASRALEAMRLLEAAGVTRTQWMAPYVDSGRELVWSIALDSARSPETRVESLGKLRRLGSSEDLERLRALESDTTEFVPLAGKLFAEEDFTIGLVARQTRQALAERLGLDDER